MCTTGLPPVPTFPHARTCMTVCIAYLHYICPADVIEKRAAAGSPWPPAPAEAAGWFSSDGSIVMVGWDRLYPQHEGSHSNYTEAMQERHEQQRKRNRQSSVRDIFCFSSQFCCGASAHWLQAPSQVHLRDHQWASDWREKPRPLVNGQVGQHSIICRVILALDVLKQLWVNVFFCQWLVFMRKWF